MPPVEVRIYREADGTVPMADWLGSLDRKSADRCLNVLRLLGDVGHELRRPYCENLGDDLYELRVKSGRVNLRMLYAFDGREAVVVTHGFAKERIIPPLEISLARARLAKYRADRDLHTSRRQE